jgi:hypothetical protein
VARHIERPTGTSGEYSDFNACLLLEDRQKVVKQAGILRLCR